MKIFKKDRPRMYIKTESINYPSLESLQRAYNKLMTKRVDRINQNPPQNKPCY